MFSFSGDVSNSWVDLMVSKPLLNHVTFSGWQWNVVYSPSQQETTLQVRKVQETSAFSGNTQCIY